MARNADTNARLDRHPPPRLVEQALTLIVRCHGGDADAAAAATAELADRRAADPAFAAACRVAEQGWRTTDGAGLREAVALPPRAGDGRLERSSRRRVLGALGIMAFATLLGGAGRWWWLQPLYEQGFATARAQILPVELPDGSRLLLNARTQASVKLYRDHREVRLEHGEIRFDVAAEISTHGGRPFAVTTPHGRVRVLGTVFSVAARDGGLQVAVAEGRVAVWSAGRAEEAQPDLELTAGQRVQGDADGLAAPVAVNRSDVAAWQGGVRDGWLVFDGTPLPEVVARWNDYLTAPLALSDAPGHGKALAALTLTGGFPLRDPGAFLASLPRALPVAVQRQGNSGWLIEPRR